MQTRKNFYLLKSTRILSGALVGVSLVLAGCASMPPPTEKMAVAKSAVDNAASNGGTEFAPVELKMARDKIAEAERAMEKEDYERAKRLADEAEVDARLAQSKASSAKAQKAVAAAQDANRVLREELERAMRPKP